MITYHCAGNQDDAFGSGRPAPEERIDRLGKSGRTLSIRGHRVRVRMEPPFWAALDDLCAATKIDRNFLIAQIDQDRGEAPLVNALRTYILNYYRYKCRPSNRSDW